MASRFNGIKIQLVDVGSWTRTQETLKTGQINLFTGAFYTVPRIQYMDYVYPAFLNTTSIAWRKKDNAIAYFQQEDLIDKSVIHNSFGQAFDEFAKDKLNLQYLTSLEQTFKTLIHDQTNFVLYEKNPGLAYADTLNISGQIKALEPAISSEGLHLTISPPSACNTGTLRGLLTKVVQDGLCRRHDNKA